jgi:hypothetical protein
MMARPSGGPLAHPTDGLDDLYMIDFYSSVKNWFVVSDAITKATQRIESSVYIFARLAASSQECLVQSGAPDGCVILRSEQTNPKRKFQLRDNLARCHVPPPCSCHRHAPCIIINAAANLKSQLGELNELRERVSKELLSAQKTPQPKHPIEQGAVSP